MKRGLDGQASRMKALKAQIKDVTAPLSLQEEVDSQSSSLVGAPQQAQPQLGILNQPSSSQAQTPSSKGKHSPAVSIRGNIIPETYNPLSVAQVK